MSAGVFKVPMPSIDYPACECGQPALWGAMVCLAHLTKEEERERRGRRPHYGDFVASGMEQPVCWSWEIPTAIPVFKSDDAALIYLREWQEWQCAICGRLYPDVTDHDHGSGLVRGELCGSCNRLEGRAPDNGRFGKYRQRNPASMLGMQVLYWSPWTGETRPEVEPTKEDMRHHRDAVDRMKITLPVPPE